MGEVHNGLHLLQNSTSQTLVILFFLPFIFLYTNSVNFTLNSSDMSKLWHLRQGHPSNSKVLCLRDVLPSVNAASNRTCDIFSSYKTKEASISFLLSFLHRSF